MANLTGSTTAVFFVRLSAAVDEIVDVDWSTRDGTAIAGKDYEAASGTVSFLPGETEKAIDVIVYGQDDASADGKKFYIELKPPANAVLTDALAECVITVEDDDGVLVTSLVIAQGKRGLKGNPGLSAYEQAVLMGYAGTVEQWMDEVGDASQAAEKAESFASQAIESAVVAGQKANEATAAVISTKQYVDGTLASQSAYLASELANQTQTVNSALSDLSTAANKFYSTLAAANADIANIQVDQPVTIGESANGGLWYKATAGSTSLTKSVYDPLTQAKNYTDDTVKNRTVLSGSANGTELAIFTDKNGRRTWIEVAADGGLTERTKEYVKDAVLVPVKDAVLVPVNSTNFSYAVTDKNGRVLSAIYKDGSIYPKQITAPTSTTDSNKQFKILAIGNSFTQDAFTYVPALLKEMGYEDFELVILSFSGSTLEQHVQFATNNTVQYDMEIYNTQTNKWSGTGEYTTTFKQAITYTNFDTIILQQQSARSHNYDTYQPHLNNLIRYIYDNIDYPTKLGWHGSPAQPDYGWVSTMTSAEFYAAQQQTFKNVLRDTPIEYVIPNGTAIQNARTTTLSTLGTGGSMTQDGLHLQDGIPCLVAAYAVTLKLLEVLKLKGSIFNSSIAPTDAWIAAQNIQGQNGTSVGVNQDNLFIAQKCAIAAIKNPTEVSTIN